MTNAAAFWKGKKVLVTGHTGFKGAWLSLWLKKLGAQVTGYALSSPSEPNLFSLAHLDRQIKSVIGDIRDLNAFLATYRECEPDVVIHMAAQALVRPSYRDPVGTYATNVMGTVHVLEAARLVPSAKSVVIVTTDKCYENREWIWGYREQDTLGGYDPYSNSKACAELATSAYRKSFFPSLGLASARAGNVIGGGDWSEDRLIPDCMRSLEKGKAIAIRNPHSIRPWQHVLEPLSGYMLLAEKLWNDPKNYSEAYNFGPSDPGQAQPVSWIADRITSVWGNGAKWEHIHDPKAVHEATFLKLDCALARNKLKWEPRLDLTRTIEWVVEWYRDVSHRVKDPTTITLEQLERYEKLRAE